jgi:signal peptidase I
MSVDAFLLAKRDRLGPLKGYQKWWFYILFFLIFNLANTGFRYGVKAVVAEAFVIPTEAMAPTIQPGDQILVDKLWFTPKRLKRDSIVVYRSAGPNSPIHIMRVVGLPGDEIEIKSEEVFVNGTKWDDKHANLSGKVLLPEMANYGPLRVPLDSFFVLGDNRRNARDSRFNGPIPLSDLVGRANIIYWSRERKNIVPGYSTRYERGPIAWDRIGICFD